MLPLLLLLSAAEPRVFVQADAHVAGPLALSLVDDGVVVVAKEEAADVSCSVSSSDGSFSVRCGELEERVEPGPPALMALELSQRVRSLVRRVVEVGPPNPPSGGGAHVAVVLRADRLADALAVELLAARVGLAPSGADVLCVEERGENVVLAWGELCVERVVTLPSTTSPRELIAAALVARRAPPPAPVVEDLGVIVDPKPLPRASSLQLRAGALARPLAVDPLLEASSFWPVWSGFGVVVAAGGSFSSVSPLLIGEGFVVAGPGVELDVLERVTLRSGVAAGAFAHGWYFSDEDAGVAFDPVLLVPVSLDVQLIDALALSLATSGGAVARSRVHEIGEQISWERGAFFLSVSVGLSYSFGDRGNSARGGAWIAR